MRVKILGIQFRKSEASIMSEQAHFARAVSASADITFISALDDTIGWSDPAMVASGYHGILLGGSGEFDFDGNRPMDDPARTISYVFLERLRPLFSYIFEHDLPTLGVCYGHQLLGAFAGAQVLYSETQKKTCSHEIKLMVDKHDYFLFSDLPDCFHAHYGHKDALDRVPEGAVLLMNGGDQCQVSALRYKNNIYTTQFHPELTYESIIERIKCTPGYLPEGVLAEEVFCEAPHSNMILENFGKFVLAREGN